MIIALIKLELTKFLSSKFMVTLTVLVSLLAILTTLASYLNPPELALAQESGLTIWASSMSNTLRFLTFLILIAGGMSFSQERAYGTLKTLLMLPIKRDSIVLSKFIFLCALAVTVLLFTAIIDGLLVAALFGLGDLYIQGVQIFEADYVWKSIAIAMGLTLVALPALVSMSQLFGIFFNASGPAVGGAVLLGVVLGGLGEAVDFAEYIFYTHIHAGLSVIEKIGKGLPFKWDWEIVINTSVPSLIVLLLAQIIYFRRLETS